VDYTFPLPKSDLHDRYDRVFECLKNGLSIALIGLPFSARSGYLKFILEYDSNFLKSFIDPNTYHFVILESSHQSSDQIVQSIAAQIISRNFLPQKFQEELENRLKVADPHLTLVSIKSALNSVYPAHKLVVILYETEKLLKDQPQAVNFLTQIWNTNRNQPNSQVGFIFIGSPKLLEDKLLPGWNSLRPAIEEQTIYFPLFNHAETSFLRHRLEFLTGNPISDPIHKLASHLSSGHTVLYRILSQLPLPELEHLAITKTHPAISNIVDEIWSGFSDLVKQNYNQAFLSTLPLKDLHCYIPLLPPIATNREQITSVLSLPVLTSQQKVIFDYFSSRSGQILSRDEIAQVLWGKLWQEKYSDWAIDQTISKLKKKLAGSKYSLLTLRNRGYQLTYC